MTIAENLLQLNEAKQAIKTAIERKGQDLTDVPFTGYAEKITAIEGGENVIVEPLTVTANGTYTGGEVDGKRVAYNPVTVDVQKALTAKDLITARGTAQALFQGSYLDDFSTILNYDDTAGQKKMQNFFANCSKAVIIPPFDTSDCDDFTSFLLTCNLLKNIPLLDTSKGTRMQQFLYYTNAEVIPAFDLRSATVLTGFCAQASHLTEIWVRNIKSNFQVGSGTSWGHLLTQESSLSLCFQCRKTGSMKTITFAKPVFDNLVTLYVKLVPITEEMRTEDDLIDEKYPFELCESTDEGAMTIAQYMTDKMWAIASA